MEAIGDLRSVNVTSQCDISDNEQVSIVVSHWLWHILINIQLSLIGTVRNHCFRPQGKQEMALAVSYRDECSIKITFSIE